MSSKINILPDYVINRIAAGEVVERPSSVVKELVENSIDAGASEISVDIEQAGRRLIKVTDNGCGMSKEDAHAAFARHATSKIASDRDLEFVRTMGFRGEALASIASVSRVRMVSAEEGASPAVLVEIDGGTIKGVSDAAGPRGTSVEIAHLFFNTPARLKFLKSPGTEFSHITTAFSRQAMAHPAVRFKLSHNGKPVFDLPASQGIRERAFQLYGNEVVDHMVEFSGERDPVRIRGLISRPGYGRADKTYQDFSVNGRVVRNPSLTHALYSAYSDMLMHDRHPAAFIFIEIDPALVDVNVHPAKAEVRFRNQSQVHDFLRDAIRQGVRAAGITGTGTAPDSFPLTEGVKEALDEYLQNTEFGTGNRELRKEYFAAGRKQSGLVNALEDSTTQIPFGGSPSRLPEGIPDSEMLFPLAQVHDSFIVAQSREGMVIVDQHAAHERVLFEKLQDQTGKDELPLQNLLIPVPMELGPSRSMLLQEYLGQLASLGLIIEDFGGGTFMIKAVPSLLTGADCRQLLLDMLDELHQHGTSRKLIDVRDGLLSVMACHPAIKVHHKLDGREMQQLLRDLFLCRMPETCPHGRPTMVAFSIGDMKKMFKRI